MPGMVGGLFLWFYSSLLLVGLDQDALGQSSPCPLMAPCSSSGDGIKEGSSLPPRSGAFSEDWSASWALPATPLFLSWKSYMTRLGNSRCASCVQAIEVSGSLATQQPKCKLEQVKIRIRRK